MKQRPTHIKTRPPNQNPNFKTSIENKPANKYKCSVAVFDDILGARNSSQRDEFYTRGRHEDLSVFYVSQSYFGLPRSIRNNSDRILIFKQNSREYSFNYQSLCQCLIRLNLVFFWTI